MKITITETPICLIKNTEVKWEVSYEIYPIQLRHARVLIETIKQDARFQGFNVDYEYRLGSVTHIVLKAENFSTDLTSTPKELEKRMDELIENYLAANDGYAAIRA